MRRCLVSLAILLAAWSAHAAPEMGVYRWDIPDGPSNVDAFSQWLGRPVPLALAFEAPEKWEFVDGADWQLGPWSQWVKAQAGRNYILSIPLLAGGWNLAGDDGVVGTADDLSLAKCALGQYDMYWKNLANELAYFGLHWAYLRLGWEMDGTWYAWRAAPQGGNEANFAGCFRRVVQVMRATQPANQWKFVWNPANTWWYKEYLGAAWPGDEYVDIVGLDVYDQSWAPDTYPYPEPCDAACRLVRQQNAWNYYSWHLYTIRDFALAHGKPMAIPEWGVVIRTDGGNGGGDNPYYVSMMHQFINDPGNNVAFHAYFNVSAPDIDARLTDSVANDNPAGPTRFPQSATRFRELFGVAPVNTPPTVSITQPAPGQTVAGTIAYAASATDNEGVSRVEFFLDGFMLLSDASAPYGGSLLTTTLTDGTHTMHAVAFDAGGLSASSQVSINVRNVPPVSTDTAPPTVSLTAPPVGTIIARRSSVTSEALAYDDIGIRSVEFLVNERRVCLVQAEPYRCSWNSGPRFERSYVVTAKATDMAGNQASSTRIYSAR